jgi:hypothetical protein
MVGRIVQPGSGRRRTTRTRTRTRLTTETRHGSMVLVFVLGPGRRRAKVLWLAQVLAFRVPLPRPRGALLPAKAALPPLSLAPLVGALKRTWLFPLARGAKVGRVVFVAAGAPNGDEPRPRLLLPLPALTNDIVVAVSMSASAWSVVGCRYSRIVAALQCRSCFQMLLCTENAHTCP